MDSIELPEYVSITATAPPPFEVWKADLRKASDDVLKQLQVWAYRKRAADGDNERWDAYKGCADSELLERGIKP